MEEGSLSPSLTDPSGVDQRWDKIVGGDWRVAKDDRQDAGPTIGVPRKKSETELVMAPLSMKLHRRLLLDRPSRHSGFTRSARCPSPPNRLIFALVLRPPI